MADVQLAPSNVLCFVCNKFDKVVAVKLLKSVLRDFNDGDILSAAKLQLIEDSGSLDYLKKSPHIPQRRDGDAST